MLPWDPQFAVRSPMFSPLRAVARGLARDAWPAPDVLNELAALRGVCSGGGVPLRFEDRSLQAAPAAADYELRIHDEGLAPLRAANWHDLFNACAWLTFPCTKAALNRAHAADLRGPGAGGPRSARRDALTLLDESGVLVLGCDASVLARLRGFEWQRVFWDERETLLRTTRFMLFGHGLYEKALSPYVGMTGHALLLEVPQAIAGADPDALLTHADTIAARAVEARLLQTRDLAPLPVLGVPGWWPANQDAVFYDNTDYFRPGRTRAPMARQA